MAWPSYLLIDQVCAKDCNSRHRGHGRMHLPLGLWRASHDGSQDTTIPPTSGFENDGCMLPRDWRSPTGEDVKRHLDKTNRLPSPFLSFGTWAVVSRRIQTWKKSKVRNIRLHFIATPLLPSTTRVYRVTGLVQQIGIKNEPYYEGEYLIQGRVQASAFLLHRSGEGEDRLVELPATRPAFFPGLDDKPMISVLPTGFFGGIRPSITYHDWPKDNLDAALYDVEYPSVFIVVSDSITCGRLFTITDWVKYYPNLAHSVSQFVSQSVVCLMTQVNNIRK